MTQTLLDTVSQDWISITAHKLTEAEVVWIDCEDEELSPEALKSMQKNMLDDNAYIVKSTPCFSNAAVNIDDYKTLVAERYGGAGIGENGGGGRCGNTEQYQLKGIGINCMIGEHNDSIHKYGGLDAPLAIIETIYTNLFCDVLPLGAVKIRGLIYTGKKSAIYHHPANICWGVIMVRDQCVRPAHFMRAAGFKPQEIFKPILVSDVSRVRKTNKRLFRYFKEHNSFIAFLGKFLQNCANQFGFARAARIMHGTLSPSNISLDGRWLDLPIASFLSGGVNYGLSSSFLNEHKAPLEYALELLHGYAKYNNVALSPTPLIKYYNNQFDAYFRHYIGYVLGLNLEHLKNIESVSWRYVTDCFSSVIHAKTYIENRQIESSDNDPVHALIAALFLSIENPLLAGLHFQTAGFHREQSMELSKHFGGVIDQLWSMRLSNRTEKCARKNNFVIATALVALKRAHLSEAFFSPLIATKTWDLCQSESPEDIGPFIDSYNTLSKWIFLENGHSTYLYKSKFTSLSYRLDDGCYYVKHEDKVSMATSYSNALSILTGTDSPCLEINGFAFTRFFEKLKNIISAMEDLHQREGDLEHK